jgi:hypothetical protein
VHNKQTNKQKTLSKSNFLREGLAHGPDIFRVDAPCMAAHFPSRVVWGWNPTNGAIGPKTVRPRPLFRKVNEYVLEQIIMLCGVAGATIPANFMEFG